MSLFGTLAKVAMGVAIAKGVSYVAKNGMPGAQGTPGAGRGTQMGGGSSVNDELGGMMDSITGGSRKAAAPQSGGLGDLLEQLGGNAAAPNRTARPNAPKGLEDLLGSLTGGGAGGGAAGGSGGLGDLLGGLLGAASGGQNNASAGGGLGGLLGSILGGAAGGAGAGAGAGAGGLGSLLNDALAGKPPATAPTPHQELAAALMLKAMIQAVKSDGKMDEAEKTKLTDSMSDATPEEIAFIKAQLNAPIDVAGLAAQVPDGMEHQVYMMSLMAINLDDKTEAQYLHTLAQALHMQPAEVNAVHDHVKAPRLYA